MLQVHIYQSRYNFFSLSNPIYLGDTKTRQMLSKSRTFCMFCIFKIIKDKHYFFLQLIAIKNNRGYHIPMINLGKSEEVTAVLKLSTQFSTKRIFQNF